MWLEGRAVYRESVQSPARSVSVAIDVRGFHVRGLTGEDIAFWSMGKLVQSQRGTTLTLRSREEGGLVEITDAPTIAAFAAALKAIPKEGDSRVPKGCMVGCATMLLLAVGVIIAIIWGIYALVSSLSPLVPDEVVAAIDAGSRPSVLSSLGSSEDRRCEGVAGNVALASLSDRLATSGAARRLMLDVAVYKGTVPNAIALPGGHILITDKLIARSANADAFAGVLAHEIGHVHYRHGLAAMIRAGGIGVALTIFTGDPSSLVGVAVSTLAGAAYSRDAEREADKFAVGSVAAAGGDPLALGPFLLDLEKEAGATPGVLSMIASHPMSAERADNIAADATVATRGAGPMISADDWSAIRNICGPQ